MTQAIKRADLQVALGAVFRQEAIAESHADGNWGILNPPGPIADKVLGKAIETVRHRQGEAEVPLLDVVEVELERSRIVLAKVNEKRGERGYTTIAKAELDAAAKLDPDLAPKLYKARDLLMHVETGVAATDLAKKIAGLTAGLTFMSESDYPYEAFYANLGKKQPLDIPTLKNLMTWDAIPGDDTGDPNMYPAKVDLTLRPADDFWLNTPDGTSDADKAKWAAVDQEMLANLVPSTATDEDGGVAKSTLWTVTPKEAGACRAPYYLFGRTKSGEVVGLKTWRVWT